MLNSGLVRVPAKAYGFADQNMHRSTAGLRAFRTGGMDGGRRVSAADGWEQYVPPWKPMWTPARDKRLQALQADGLSAAQIAKKLGTTRNAVIGRARRLRGIVYQSDIDSWKRANARRSAEAHKRASARADQQKKALAEMTKALNAGVAKPKAMLRAFRAGAYWRQIGDYFGISQQAAYEAAKKARRPRK
jgi:transposase